MSDAEVDQQGTRGGASDSVEVDDPGAVGLVDWARTGRRVRTSVVVLAVLVVATWLVLGLTGDGLRLGTLGGLVGLAFALLFVVELVVVGGAALRGMLRAGERGERLASDGVGLLPPRKQIPPRGSAEGDGTEGDGTEGDVDAG